MDTVLTIIGLVVIAGFFISVPLLLKKIAKRLYRIQLLLDYQNPGASADSLWQFDQIYNYWQDKNDKYHHDFSDENKKLRDLIFERYLCQMRKREVMARYRYDIIAHKGDVYAVDEKLDDELDKLDEEARKIEDKLIKLDLGIGKEIEKIRLDFEFKGQWKYDED